MDDYRDILEENKIKRKYERKWRVSKLTEDREGFKAQKTKYDKLLRGAHTKYLSELISDNSNDPKSLFKMIDSIVSNSKENILPAHESEIELAERFNEYFMDRLENNIKLLHRGDKKISSRTDTLQGNFGR